ISRNNSALLEAGNIITVEPGIYIPKKYGVRIEDTVLILKNETVVLSKSPKELIEIAI
ncbi:MAG: M24 family metallopeptidase, partial [Clostridia bacterium]|nr:M24 family metallopeptidase [Clostridia bacterium]